MDLVLDQQAMIVRLRSNLTIVSFCTNDLKEKSQFSGNAILLLSNFSFLLKSSLMQVILVSLSRFPVSALLSLMCLEIGYTLTNAVSYARNQHLKSFFLLFPRLVQSLLLIIVEFYLLVELLQLSDLKFTFTTSS